MNHVWQALGLCGILKENRIVSGKYHPHFNCGIFGILLGAKFSEIPEAEIRSFDGQKA